MLDYLLMFIAVVLMTGTFVTQKMFQNKIGNTSDANFKFNAFGGVFKTVIFVVLAGVMQNFEFSFTPFSAIMAALTAIISFVYLLFSFPMLKSGQMATYTLFLMTGGSMVPYVFGLIKLGEPFSVLRTVGLVLIVAGVVFANFQKTNLNFKYIFMGVCVFFLNGLMSTVSKLHQIEEGYSRCTEAEFVVLQAIALIVLGTVSWIIWAIANPQKISELKSRTKEEKRDKFFWTFVLCLATSVLGGVSYILQLASASNLPATVVYPFLTGGSIILTAISGLLFFREKISKKVLTGVILCFVGTLMFL